MLKMKTFKQIMDKLIRKTTEESDELTDFSVGSAIRTLYTAIALNIEEFYHYMYDNIKYMIENSLYVAFGFELLPATTAEGFIELTFDTPLTVPLVINEGTVFVSSKPIYRGIEFSAVNTETIPIGSGKHTIRVRCTKEGLIGNVSENSIDTKVNQDPRIVLITNPKAISGGADKETYNKRVERFKRFISSLSKATQGSLEYAAYSVSGITGVTLDDSRAGIVKMFCHDSQGNLSEELKEKVKKEVDKVRAAGVEVIITGVYKSEISLKLHLVLAKNKDIGVYTNLIQLYITNWINTLPVGYTLTLAELYQVVMNSYDDAVLNVKIIEPTSDIKGSYNSILIVSSIEVGGENA